MSQENTYYNRKYKDSLFRFIFNSKVAVLREKISDGLSLGDAIEETITECIEKDILADILREHRAEVTDMLFKEYDSAAHIASEKEISYEEGLKMVYAKQNKILLKKRNVLTNFSLP